MKTVSILNGGSIKKEQPNFSIAYVHKTTYDQDEHVAVVIASAMENRLMFKIAYCNLFNGYLSHQNFGAINRIELLAPTPLLRLMPKNLLNHHRP